MIIHYFCPSLSSLLLPPSVASSPSSLWPRRCQDHHRGARVPLELVCGEERALPPGLPNWPAHCSTQDAVCLWTIVRGND